MKVKIYGAGSIGNHLAQASRRIGWEVTVVDPNKSALERMKNEIYPTRYGAWDETIELFELGKEPKGSFDVIFLGTPPDVRMEMAYQVLTEKARVLQLEKPICTPDFKGVDKFLNELKNYPVTKVVTGYDHVISKITQKAEEIIRSGRLGKPQSLDVEFREHWGGIFSAHPWLKGPEDTYLGFWKRGGGASGEHSHATNLWQYFAHLLGLGKVKKVSASLQMVKTDKVEYDQSCFVTLETEKGFIGRVAQDVIQKPVKKRARIQFEKGFLELIVGATPEGDMIKYEQKGEIKEHFVQKKRPDDFYQEVLHIRDIIEGRTDIKESPIALELGLDTMLVIAAAHKSHSEGRIIEIEAAKGYNLSDLR